MTIAELLQWAVKQVDSIAVDSPHLSVEVLMAHALNRSRSFLYANPEYILSNKEEQQFKFFLHRFSQGEPIAYITEKREFWSLPLKVTADTLIPRQETELLVEWVLKNFTKSDYLIADLGTGSGAIALAIGHERPNWKIIATDQSAAALEVARGNAKNLNIKNVEFVQGDWFAAFSLLYPLLSSRGLSAGSSEESNLTLVPRIKRGATKSHVRRKFDIIISNPPYLAEEELHSGLSYEPRAALIAQEAGLSDIRQIVHESWDYLKEEGYLLIEHGQTQGEKVRSIFLEVGYNDIQTGYDLANRERITWGRRG